MSRVSGAMVSDARPHLPTEGAANSSSLFASRATTQMSAIAPKPEGTGLSGRSALSRISSRKASVAATRDLFRGSLAARRSPAQHLDHHEREHDFVVLIFHLVAKTRDAAVAMRS